MLIFSKAEEIQFMFPAEPEWSSIEKDVLVELIEDYNINNVDFLACNSLKYDLFKNYYNKINEFSDVIIGASDDKRGNIKYGGDWILESTNEDIKNIFDASKL